ncbi:hypothetical protein I552_3792 [Mycobacterium xenopi 3993]|nr:hypothetical protein I552_3792 [Mycobacterium xenopi 3993]
MQHGAHPGENDRECSHCRFIGFCAPSDYLPGDLQAKPPMLTGLQ